MKKAYSFILLLLILNACGGGREENKKIEKIDLRDILMKNSWYEVCDNGIILKYDFYNDKYIKTVYSDDDFKNKRNSITYNIIEYNDIEFKTKNEICKSSTIIFRDSNNTLSSDNIMFECTKKVNNNLEINLISAWKSKKLAKENIEECIE